MGAKVAGHCVLGAPQDTGELLELEPDEAKVQAHYYIETPGAGDVDVVQAMVTRFHTRHYDMDWDLHRRAAVPHSGHLKFYVGVRRCVGVSTMTMMVLTGMATMTVMVLTGMAMTVMMLTVVATMTKMVLTAVATMTKMVLTGMAMTVMMLTVVAMALICVWLCRRTSPSSGFSSVCKWCKRCVWLHADATASHSLCSLLAAPFCAAVVVVVSRVVTPHPSSCVPSGLAQVLLACIGLLIMPGSATQMLYAFMVVTVFTVLILHVSPFVFSADSLLASACGIVLWIGVFFGFLSRIGVVPAGSLSFEVIGYLLSVCQVALPTLCVFMLLRNFMVYAWELFVVRHAPGVEKEVLRTIPAARRLSMMLSLKKSQIKALVKAADSTAL